MSLTKTGKSGQKFIARNRAPRVQIEYDVEIYGSEKKVQIPFVMGVLADLSGKPVDPLPEIADRKFLEIDIDNFDARMKSIKPRVPVQWDHTLKAGGTINNDQSCDRMEEVSPAANARREGALNSLLEARTQLHNLLSYMDGKQWADELNGYVLKDTDPLKTLGASPIMTAPNASRPASEA
jgi:type VI secretion system protein ImpB